MKRIKVLIVLLTGISLMMTSCADVPDNVKDKKQGQEDKVTVSDGVTVDKLLEGAEDIPAYIKAHSYEGKFLLDGDVHIELPEHLYELETETVTDAHLKFPEIYSELFKRDFYTGSGVKELSELPPGSQHHNEDGFFFDDWSNTGDSIIYTDGGARRLDVSTGGFMYFLDEKNYSYDGALREIIRAGSTPLPDREFTLLNNEKCSLKAIAEYAESRLNTVFGYFGDQYTYRAGMIYPYTSDNEKTWFYIDMEKCYKGVPFCNQVITDHTSEGRRQFAPIYVAEMDESQHIFDIDCPFGIDRVTSEKELTEGLVSLPQALDIMNNELSPKIELRISDIRLCYMCDYDSEDVDAVIKLRETAEYQDMSREQQLLLGNPTLLPGRKYTAYPVWEFRLDRQQRDEAGNYLQQEACDIITVDVRTGKLSEYFDKVAQR